MRMAATVLSVGLWGFPVASVDDEAHTCLSSFLLRTGWVLCLLRARHLFCPRQNTMEAPDGGDFCHFSFSPLSSGLNPTDVTVTSLSASAGMSLPCDFQFSLLAVAEAQMGPCQAALPHRSSPLFTDDA